MAVLIRAATANASIVPLVVAAPDCNAIGMVVSPPIVIANVPESAALRLNFCNEFMLTLPSRKVEAAIVPPVG